LKAKKTYRAIHSLCRDIPDPDMAATREESWLVGTVRYADGTTNCFFGHLFRMGANDRRGDALWNAFESLWATTYRIYPINAGENPSWLGANAGYVRR
jgi:hypothetical protein